MERQSGTVRKYLTTESAPILEALIAVMLGYYLLGFEVTVPGTLSVIGAHVFKLS